MKSIWVFVLILGLFGMAAAQIPADVMPFGYFFPQNPGNGSSRDSIKNYLGANVLFNGWNVGSFDSIGVKSIKSFKILNDSIANIYSDACYSLWQAEDDTSAIKFTHIEGHIDSVGSIKCWAAPTLGYNDTTWDGYVFLDHLLYWQNYETDYTPILHMWANPDTSCYGDTIAYLVIYQTDDWWTPNYHDSLYAKYPIIADTFIGQNNLINYQFSPYAAVSSGNGHFNTVNYCIGTTGKCSIKIDYLKIVNASGNTLMSGALDSLIDSLLSYNNSNGILGWELRDEPGPDMYLPYRHVDSLIGANSNNIKYGTSCFNWDYSGGSGRYFVKSVEPKIWTTNLYPFRGNCGIPTKYTGNDHTSSYYGLQDAFKFYITRWIDSVKAIQQLADTKWWYVPQILNGSDSYCQGEYQYRWPTPSELACETYIGLCYHPDGIILYQHGITGSDNWSYRGLYNFNNTLKSDLFNKLKDDINPYIKAIDGTYMGLTWDTAYTYCPYYSFYPPSSSVIDSIVAENQYSCSDTNYEIPNDLGWFHVGEYHDSVNAKYFMLVNRSCNCSERDSSEAAPVIAKIFFDATNINMDIEEVMIVDIAGSINTYDSSGTRYWKPIPDTTYCFYQNGKLEFVDTLKAGQGKLYKIAQAPCMYWLGNVNGDTLLGGADIIYLNAFFKGGTPPPDSCYNDSIARPNHYLYVASDVTSDCIVGGADITRLVNYFKGTAQLEYCRFFHPTRK